MDEVSVKEQANKPTGKLPGTARVVVIGGGAVGASVLYHLAERGWRDVVLLEKNELTSGSTWHAAGNCPNYVGSWTIMKIQSYSTSLYRKLGDLVDYPMNYHVTGAIRLAHSRQRMEEFRHVERMGRQMGIEFQEMSPAEMQEVYPFLETHDLYGGQWDPLDGDIDPAQLTQALAKGARDMGATVIRFCPVTGARRENGEWVLSTPQGDIRCEYVVNASGYRANEVGRMFGRDVPCISLAHQYLVTEGIPELAARDTKLPLLRDPDSSYYLRQEKDGLLLGPYEKGCRAHWTDASDPMPEDFSFQLYSDDLERLEWYIEDACARVPLLGTAGITRVVNGPIPYAPDGLPLIGQMPGVPNAFEACVFTFGIVQAGGAGKLLSETIARAKPRPTAGPSIRGVSPIMSRMTMPGRRRSRPTVMNTPCIFRKSSGRPVARPRYRRSMTRWPRPAPPSGPMAAGSVPTGSRATARRTGRRTVMTASTGSMPLAPNAGMSPSMSASWN